jgi:hypothetical protein
MHQRNQKFFGRLIFCIDKKKKITLLKFSRISGQVDFVIDVKLKTVLLDVSNYQDLFKRENPKQTQIERLTTRRICKMLYGS